MFKKVLRTIVYFLIYFVTRSITSGIFRSAQTKWAVSLFNRTIEEDPSFDVAGAVFFNPHLYRLYVMIIPLIVVAIVAFFAKWLLEWEERNTYADDYNKYGKFAFLDEIKSIATSDNVMVEVGVSALFVIFFSIVDVGTLVGNAGAVLTTGRIGAMAILFIVIIFILEVVVWYFVRMIWRKSEDIENKKEEEAKAAEANA